MIWPDLAYSESVQWERIMLDKKCIREYEEILKEELIPAQGCTEPIAIAYAAAKAKQLLGCNPERTELVVSGNIVKNVKSVTVPNTGGLKGLEAAAAAGFVAGNADAVLGGVASISAADLPAIREYLAKNCIAVSVSPKDRGNFYIDLTAHTAHDQVRIVLEAYHTNITRIEKNGEVLMEKPKETISSHSTNRDLLNIRDILTYADSADLQPVRDILERQISYNSAVAREGLASNWGACVGKSLLATYGDSVRTRARALAAAGSDARMSGCELPVVIVSGSGNQGITTSVPVIVYAEELKVDHEKLLRAVALADLITIHQKTSIGSLSAFCGATSAGCGAAAGIAYLYGGGYDAIAHTITNALAIVSGMICDGAKPSCAAKISMAVEAGIMGLEMYNRGNQFCQGDGILSGKVDKTIENVGRIAREGMQETDNQILDIMVGD